MIICTSWSMATISSWVFRHVGSLVALTDSLVDSVTHPTKSLSVSLWLSSSTALAFSVPLLSLLFLFWLLCWHSGKPLHSCSIPLFYRDIFTLRVVCCPCTGLTCFLLAFPFCLECSYLFLQGCSTLFLLPWWGASDDFHFPSSLL